MSAPAEQPAQERTLVTDLAAAMLAAREVKKSSRNTDQNYDYASIEQILGAIRGPLLERSMIVNARTVDLVLNPVTSKQGSQGTSAIVTVDFEYLHGPTGDKLVSDGWRGQGVDYGDKAISKAYTSAAKSFIKLEWLLSTDADQHADLPDAVATQAPAWAREARPERRDELAQRLLSLGVDPDVLLGSIEQTIGHIPDIVVSFARAIPAGNQTSPQPAAADVPPAPAAAGDHFPQDEPDGPPDVHPEQGALV